MSPCRQRGSPRCPGSVRERRTAMRLGQAVRRCSGRAEVLGIAPRAGGIEAEPAPVIGVADLPTAHWLRRSGGGERPGAVKTAGGEVAPRCPRLLFGVRRRAQSFRHRVRSTGARSSTVSHERWVAASTARSRGGQVCDICVTWGAETPATHRYQPAGVFAAALERQNILAHAGITRDGVQRSSKPVSRPSGGWWVRFPHTPATTASRDSARSPRGYVPRCRWVCDSVQPLPW